MKHPITYTCTLCRNPTTAQRDSALAMLKLCQPCSDARIAKGRAAQEAGK